MAVLARPISSGVDCLCIVQIAIRLSLVMDEIDAATVPWMQVAYPRYAGLLSPAACRLINRPERVCVREGGIVLPHQAAAFSHSWMQLAFRASLQFRPNLDKPSVPVVQALQHGVPYATGVSGSTNILLHLAGHFKQLGTDLPIPHLLLAGMMLFNGGHSMHEVLWVAHRLDQMLGLDLRMSDAEPDRFIADYTRFFALFDGFDRRAIDHAVARAWDETLAYMALEDKKLGG